MKIIAKNKKAFHDYEIKNTIEAGIVLTGDEVKSLRQGNISLVDSYATMHNGEINLTNCYIGPYSHAYLKEDTSRKSRKLLLHKKEIDKLIGEISKKGMTIIPLKIYFNQKGFVKLELGIGKHKKAAGKKKELREKDILQQAKRETKYKI
ncbi:MAG: SsrA-binding protein SmpB [bacterium]